MGITHYLAMTAAEFSFLEVLPPAAAWMACHLSAYGSGLSNLPRDLPPGTLLVLDDSTPVAGHDPALIGQQLEDCLAEFDCCGLLLDFQRPGNPEAAALAAHLAGLFASDVAVSEAYHEGLSCPVFLPPLPCHCSLESHLAPWAGREIWLETALEGETLTLTESGAQFGSLEEAPTGGFSDSRLHCHYRIAQQADSLVFSLWRTREDLAALLREAEERGITRAAGLYQELGRP